MGECTSPNVFFRQGVVLHAMKKWFDNDCLRILKRSVFRETIYYNMHIHGKMFYNMHIHGKMFSVWRTHFHNNLYSGNYPEYANLAEKHQVRFK